MAIKEIESAVSLQGRTTTTLFGRVPSITTNYFNSQFALFIYLSIYLSIHLFIHLAESMRKTKDLHSQFWKFLVGRFSITA